MVLLVRFLVAGSFQVVLTYSHVNVYWMSSKPHMYNKGSTSVFRVFCTFFRLLRLDSKVESHNSPSLLPKGFLITEQLFVTELGSIVKHLNCKYTFQNSMMLTALKALKQPRVLGHGPEEWRTSSMVPGELRRFVKEPRCCSMEQQSR